MKSVFQDRKECWVCGNPKVESHHIFNGNPGRKLSEKFGLKIYLCHLHHNEPPHGIHFDKWLDDRTKAMAQEYFERTHTHEEFMEIFGRNYL